MQKLILSLLLATQIYAYEDLGTEGGLYPIKEHSILIDIASGLEMLKKKYTRKYISTLLKKEIKKRSVAHTKLSQCKKSYKEIEPNFIKIQEDIYNPNGRLYKHKGESVIIENKYPLNFCFIKGNAKEIKKQIKEYDKIVEKLGGQSCIYLVSDTDVLDLDKEFAPRAFYPSSEGLEEALGIDCYPALVHLKDKVRFKFYR